MTTKAPPTVPKPGVLLLLAALCLAGWSPWGAVGAEEVGVASAGVVNAGNLPSASSSSRSPTATPTVSATPTATASLMVAKLVDKEHAAPGEVLQYSWW